MSISSKSRRDARRRRTPQGASARSDAPQIHAQLKGPDDRVLAGATYADGEWTFVLRGEPVTSTASAAMLLRHSLGLDAEARAVERAVSEAVKDGARTRDLGGSLSTVAAADEVLARLARETTAA